MIMLDNTIVNVAPVPAIRAPACTCRSRSLEWIVTGPYALTFAAAC